MTPHLWSLLLAGILLAPAPATAGKRLAADPHGHDLRATHAGQDPFAPVHIVTSRETWQGIRRMARNAAARRDSLGRTVVVSQVRAHQLGAVSEHVHRRERRCGGYFAFGTRREAEAFVRADRSAVAAKATAAGYTLDSAELVRLWMPRVREANLYATIDHLSSYRNRYYASETGRTSALWIRDTWQALARGRSDVTAELFTACSGCSTQPSVILTIAGTDRASEIVVLGGHLDSINSSGNGSPTQHAPGADDDASGIATLTEVLRVALEGGWRPQRTVKFMAYAAEEVGLRGSRAIAESFRAGGADVVGVLQVDMTNYKSGGVDDMQLVTDYSNAGLQGFLVDLFDAYLAPMGLRRGTDTCGYACSDHASWTAVGYPAAFMFEAGDVGGSFPYIHSTRDTLATMGESAAHSVKFAQFSLAFLAELGKTSTATATGGNLPADIATP